MKGSFSESGLWSQIFMLLFLCLGGAVLFTSLGLILGSVIYDYKVSQLLEFVSSGGNVEVQKYLQGVSTIGTFMLPALFAAFLFSDDADDLLKVQNYPKNGLKITVLIVILTLSATTISDALYRLSRSISFPDYLEWLESSIAGTEELMSSQLEAFLRMESFRDFAGVFFILAILPALCEETLFRGVLQPVILKHTGRTNLAVWVSAFAFALLHMQFYTFLSIFALGAVLGYVKVWTGSLWPSVIVHLINNGSIVVAIYFFDMSYAEVNDLGSNWDYWYALPGMGVFAACLILLYRNRVESHKDTGVA